MPFIKRLLERGAQLVSDPEVDRRIAAEIEREQRRRESLEYVRWLRRIRDQEMPRPFVELQERLSERSRR